MTTLSKPPIFRPSSAHRWFNCPGSATLEAQVPESGSSESSVFALEGSAAHELCRYFAMHASDNYKIDKSIGNNVKDVLPLGAFNPDDFTYPEDIDRIKEILIDPQMASAVWMYCKYVYSIINSISTSTSMLDREIVRFEEKVKTSFDVEGTADCLILDWPTELHVIDFKYGAGISVDVEENLQLLIYAIGALGIESDFDKVTLTIVQPRDKFGNYIKTWTITQQELTNKWVKKLEKAHSTCINKPSSYKIGDWCRWCKGASAGICTKVNRTAKGLAKTKKDTRVPVEVKKLSKLLQSEKAVLEYFNRAKMEAFNRLQRGESIPGYKLVQSFGNITWKDKFEAEKVALTYGLDFTYNQKFKTPNQLKKAFDNEFFDTDWIDEHTHRPSKGLVLVPDTDKRTEYASAKKDFEDE